MKKLLVLTIVLSTVVAQAYTTRARNNSLQNSPHIADFYSPENLHLSANSVVIETGSTTAATDLDWTDNANAAVEGTFVKSTDLGVFGLTIGHQEDMIFSNRRLLTQNGAFMGTIDAQQNPIQFGFGTKMADFNVGAALIYSNYENKTSNEKENSMGLKLGASNSLFYVNGAFIFADKYESGSNEYKGKLGIDVKGGYNVSESFSVHGQIRTSDFEFNDPANEYEVKQLKISAKAIHLVKKDEFNIFYGAGLLHIKNEVTSVGSPNMDVKALALPIIVGVETNLEPWLTLRASLTQDVVLSNYENKDFTPAGKESPGLNTTTVAAGAGFNVSKITIDGTILTGGSQNLDGNNLLTQVGVRYNF